MSNIPPSESIDTFAPVFPKGRRGTVFCVSVAFAIWLTGAMTAPNPAVPVAFKKSLRDNLPSFWVIL
jgi:hypothetical protein